MGGVPVMGGVRRVVSRFRVGARQLSVDACGDVPAAVSVVNVTATAAVVTWRAVPHVASGPIGGALLGYVVNVSRLRDATGCDWVVGCRASPAATSCTIGALAMGDTFAAKVIPVYEWGPGGGCAAGSPPACPRTVFRTERGLPTAPPPIVLATVTSTSVRIRLGPVPLAVTGGFSVLSYRVATIVGGVLQPTLVLAARPSGEPTTYFVSSLPPRALLSFTAQAMTSEGSGPAARLTTSTCGEEEHGDVRVGGVPTCIACPIDRTCNGSAHCALPGYSGAMCSVCNAGCGSRSQSRACMVSSDVYAQILPTGVYVTVFAVPR